MTDDSYRQLMKHAHRLAMDGHGELAQFLRDAMTDAQRYRYLRNRNPRDVLQTVGDAAGCWIDCELGEVLTLLTGDDADATIDAAMAAAPAVGAA